MSVIAGSTISCTCKVDLQCGASCSLVLASSCIHRHDPVTAVGSDCPIRRADYSSGAYQIGLVHVCRKFSVVWGQHKRGEVNRSQYPLQRFDRESRCREHTISPHGDFYRIALELCLDRIGDGNRFRRTPHEQDGARIHRLNECVPLSEAMGQFARDVTPQSGMGFTQSSERPLS